MPKGYRHNNTSLRACLCPAFALPLPAGRRQAGGRQAGSAFYVEATEAQRSSTQSIYYSVE